MVRMGARIAGRVGAKGVVVIWAFIICIGRKVTRSCFTGIICMCVFFALKVFLVSSSLTRMWRRI